MAKEISRENIINIAKEIVSKEGIQAVNMRYISKKAGFAVGSIYNYFPSKNDLIIAVVESIWEDIFHIDKGFDDFDRFTEYIEKLFENIVDKSKNYPNFFTLHSIGFMTDKDNKQNKDDKGKETMDRYFSHMKIKLLEILNNDKNIKKDAFNVNFTKEKFIDFVFSNIIIFLMRDKNDCEILIETINRSIY